MQLGRSRYYMSTPQFHVISHNHNSAWKAYFMSPVDSNGRDLTKVMNSSVIGIPHHCMRTHAQAKNIPHRGRCSATQPSSVHESEPLHMAYAEYWNMGWAGFKMYSAKAQAAPTWASRLHMVLASQRVWAVPALKRAQQQRDSGRAYQHRYVQRCDHACGGPHMHASPTPHAAGCQSAIGQPARPGRTSHWSIQKV